MTDKRPYVQEGGFGERMRKPQMLGKSNVKEIIRKDLEN